MKEKQIQISQKLFITLVKCFVLDMELDCEEIAYSAPSGS